MICVISKAVYGDHAVHDIQTSEGWESNPYGDTYAIVPPDLVESIMQTNGFCDIELSADGDAIVSFTPRETPEPEPDICDEPTLESRVETLETTTDDMILLMAELIGGE